MISAIQSREVLPLQVMLPNVAPEKTPSPSNNDSIEKIKNALDALLLGSGIPLKTDELTFKNIDAFSKAGHQLFDAKLEAIRKEISDRQGCAGDILALVKFLKNNVNYTNPDNTKIDDISQKLITLDKYSSIPGKDGKATVAEILKYYKGQVDEFNSLEIPSTVGEARLLEQTLETYLSENQPLSTDNTTQLQKIGQDKNNFVALISVLLAKFNECLSVTLKK